ncbi:heme-binding protein [Methanolobus sp. ZRKC2]|uniref:SOUL family heme-binding protein n=1 Tax=Methanolobus sp. ZRKC2 TaxID=3125783 RepID=UPI003251EC08
MERKEVIFGILAIVGVLIVIWFLAGVMVSMSSEKVDYVILEELEDDVEIRQYGDLALITITSDGTNSAFSALASYISGNNNENVEISMTAPVFSDQGKGAVNMSFVLPEEYNSKDIPVPENSNIGTSRLPPRKVATITFSGYVSDSSYEEHRAELDRVLDEHGIKTKGDYFLMRYDPPWIPSVLMRNEVAIEVQ